MPAKALSCGWWEGVSGVVQTMVVSGQLEARGQSACNCRWQVSSVWTFPFRLGYSSSRKSSMTVPTQSSLCHLPSTT